MHKPKLSPCHTAGDAMDHAEALRLHAAERYLLGELAPREIEAFEEHYFECLECSDEVSAGMTLRYSAKAAFAEMPGLGASEKLSTWRAWFRWVKLQPLAQAACVLLGLVVGYQNLAVIPQLRSAAELKAPEAVASLILAPSARGEGPVLVVPAPASSFHLAFDVPTAGGFDEYRCTLRSASGASVWTVSADKMDPVFGFHLLVPAKGFVSGSYEAVLLGIREGKEIPLERYRFNVERR